MRSLSLEVNRPEWIEVFKYPRGHVLEKGRHGHTMRSRMEPFNIDFWGSNATARNMPASSDLFSPRRRFA